jgi:hypothetical protein
LETVLMLFGYHFGDGLGAPQACCGTRGFLGFSYVVLFTSPLR